MTSGGDTDVVILGSGVAGLAAALAADELGLRPLVLEKASTLGGGTIHSYGLVWVGQNHLAQAACYRDARDEVIAYLRFLGERHAGVIERWPPLSTAREPLGRVCRLLTGGAEIFRERRHGFSHRSRRH